MEWDVERLFTRDVVPEVLLLATPTENGSYRIAIEVTDRGDGRVARTERVIAVEPPR